MSTAGALDDYLDELLAEAIPVAVEAPAVAVAATPLPTPRTAAAIPGDSADLEAAFEEALAAMQAKPPASEEPTWDDVPPEPPQAPTDVAADNAAKPTWDDLPDEVIYETGPAESAKLAHADSPALQNAFDTAAGVSAATAAPMPTPTRAPIARAQPAPESARPNSWQELQAQARHPANGPNNRRASERASRWLRLRCGQQTYALELLKVQEVVLPVPLLALRGTDSSMLGIMNLRGQVVPVMDMCLHLGIAAMPDDPQTRIVVLEENGEVLGLRVSAVEDVASLTDSQIEPPDTARICQISNELFRGIARVGSQPMILLDATRLLQ
ncbi:MAG: chemotaxis protein CheW [Stenotrophomonas sp.]|uniref:chemotaxis protein CheW n=1 Tax=Stenotrophomonas sp. TaxID=69392 RepID=UPI003D6D3DD5